MAEPVELTDAELKALAHPLRIRLFEALRHDGPSTASALGRRFDETSGATSYHLRHLERHGFIEEDVGRGTGRERWWKITRRDLTVSRQAFRKREETRGYVDLLLHEVNRARLERLYAWREHSHKWPDEWIEASTDTDASLNLTHEEFAQLSRDLRHVIERYAQMQHDRPPPQGSATVDVQIYAYPTGQPDE